MVGHRLHQCCSICFQEVTQKKRDERMISIDQSKIKKVINALLKIGKFVNRINEFVYFMLYPKDKNKYLNSSHTTCTPVPNEI